VFLLLSICHDLTRLHLGLVVQERIPGDRTRRAWRQGDKRRDKKSEIEVKRVSNDCACGARIQKTDGCDDMTCKSICRLS
jgi:hypothetical protein